MTRDQLALNYKARPLSRREGPASSMKAGEDGTASGEFARHEDLIVEAIRLHPGRNVHGLADVIPELDAHQIGKRMHKIAEDKRARPVGQGTKPRIWFPGAAPEKDAA